MPRYIDADALKAEMSKDCPDDRMVQLFVMIFNACVDNAPTADVRENKKGKWIYQGKNKKAEWKCSECGDCFDIAGYNFCPNCGADMRGGQDA